MTTSLFRPQGGESLYIRAKAGETLHLGFHPGEAYVERVNDDLIFIMPDGQVSIRDFFTFDEDDLPEFSLSGVTFGGAELLWACHLEGLLASPSLPSPCAGLAVGAFS